MSKDTWREVVRKQLAAVAWQVEMIRHESPSVNPPGPTHGETRRAGHEVRAVGVIPKEELSIEPATITYCKVPGASKRA